MSEQETFFFAQYFEWNLSKLAMIILNVIIAILGPVLIGALVWYDHNTVNSVRKNIISQLMTYLYKSLITVCIINSVYYFVRVFLSPLSRSECDGLVFFGRWTFVYLFTHTCIRQFFKVLYIYNWAFLVGLNDDFVAFYVTVMVGVFATCLTFATYMLGFHVKELDFNLCTGKHPMENIKAAMKDLKLPFNASNLKGFTSHYIDDPMATFSVILFWFFVLLLILTWFYPFFKKLYKYLKRVGMIFGWSQGDQVQAFTTRNDLEIKQIMLGTAQTVLIFVCGFLSLVPYTILQIKIELDPNLVNNELRTFTYLSKIIIPLFYFIIMPIIFILFHRKFKSYVARELEARPIITCINMTEETNEVEFHEIPH